MKKEPDHNRVLVAISGGVDSSVAAYLLKQRQATLIGATMCLGVTDEQGRASCCGPQAVKDARDVCTKLDIPHYVLDFSRQLQTDVIDDFIGKYKEGYTPNPCVRCNRYLKFSALYNYARSCGYEAIATGHYARIAEFRGRKVMARHHDPVKDQTYFLYSIPPEVLEHVVFPLENMLKTEVRELARQAGIPVAGKRESQEICFIPDNNYRNFLRQHGVTDTPGNFVTTSGKVLGTHRGIHHYTIGQRKGLGVATGAPCYVVAFDKPNNTVILGAKDDLYTRSLTAEQVNLFVDELPERCTAKVRYTQTDIPCRAVFDEGLLQVTFDSPVEAVTPGQSVVLYYNDIVLGGGIIRTPR